MIVQEIVPSITLKIDRVPSFHVTSSNVRTTNVVVVVVVVTIRLTAVMSVVVVRLAVSRTT